MNTINKIILTLAIITLIYILVVSIIAVKQHYTIKTLQDNIIDNKTVIAELKQELSSPEYKIVKKCTSQKVWVKECIEWEFNNAR
jgi:hypothetical protein